MAEENRAQQLYDEYRKKTLDDIKSQTQNFDDNLLKFSSGALGLSLAFIKDVVPLPQAIWIWCLFLSWMAFAVCILVTLASFQLSVVAHRRSLPALEAYYIKGRQEALDSHLKTLWVRALDWCTFIGSASFLGGVILTLLFVAANVWKVRQ